MTINTLTICLDMEFLEVLTEGLERVLIVRGGGREVITIYSWRELHNDKYKNNNNNNNNNIKKNDIISIIIGNCLKISSLLIKYLLKNKKKKKIHFTFSQYKNSYAKIQRFKKNLFFLLKLHCFY